MLQNTFFRLKKVALPVQVDCFIEYKSTKTRLNKRIYEIKEILLVYEYALPCLGISILGEFIHLLFSRFERTFTAEGHFKKKNCQCPPISKFDTKPYRKCQS